MSPAARELALIGHAKQREPILSKAREMCAAMGKQPPAGLYPPLLLCAGDKL